MFLEVSITSFIPFALATMTSQNVPSYVSHTQMVQGALPQRIWNAIYLQSLYPVNAYKQTISNTIG